MMHKLRALWIRLCGVLRARQAEEDFAAELEDHVALHTEDGIRAGLTPAEARRQALIRLGGAEQTRQAYRERRILPWLENLLRDVCYALRQMRKSPGFALLAIGTLALGVGANTAIFAVIESVVLRPLPYAHADRLLYIGPKSDAPGFTKTSWLNYRDIRSQSRLLKDLGGYSEDLGVVENADGPQNVVAPRVTPNLLSMLGTRPLLGRAFTEPEGVTGGPSVVMLSEELWRQSFHADRSIIGQSIKVSGALHTVVGVMPASFQFPHEMGPDIRKGIWLPLQPSQEMLSDRGYQFFSMVGELAPEVTRAQAQQELDAIAAHISGTATVTKDTNLFRASPYQELLTGTVRPVLFALFAAVALVLLIACANVSHLMIARCLGRQQEFAVRSALGAGRWRLARQMLLEGMLLSLLGCGAGVILAQLALRLVRKLPDGTIPGADSIGLHWTVLLALAAIAMATTVLSSLLPALLVARSDPQTALQAASRGVGPRTVSGKLTGWLVAGEVALSTLLLVGAGLLFHTLWNLQEARLGFDADRVTTFSATPEDAAGFSNMAVSDETQGVPASVATLVYQPVLDRMRQTPGVQSAALITALPLTGFNINSSFEILGQANIPANAAQARISAVSGDYARTMGTPVLRGRMIGDADVSTTPFVIVINHALEKKYFAGKDPVGKQISMGGKDTGMIKPYSIIGVLADQVDNNVGSAAVPMILLPQQQIPVTSLFYQALLKTTVSFVVKTGAEIPVAAEMRSVFHQAAPGFALDDFQSMRALVDKNTFSHKLGLYLVGLFAGLAVAMVIAGLYGVLSQFVSYRRHEIGVRMALGASRRSVARLVLRRGAMLIGTGLAAGLLLALAAGRLINGFLYQVQPLDAWTYLFAALLLTCVGLIATLIPARAATKIEPMQALRME
jgi:predicted permease